MPDAFEYVAPTPDSVGKIQVIRDMCFDLKNELLDHIVDCRERSIAITKLEEVSMWANKAIVFTQGE